MTDLKGKVIVVTGASSGIGKAIVESLVSVGAKVVGCARNVEKLKEIATSLNGKGPGEMHAVKCDVTKEEDVINAFKFTEDKFGTLHATINNAGMVEAESLLSGKSEGWMRMLQVNVLGVSMCAREAVKLMKKCGVENGHVVNMSSVAGHIISSGAGQFYFYTATKFAVRALTEGLRQELRAEKSHIRVSSVSPGVVKSEFGYRVPGASSELVDKFYSQMVALESEDIANAVLFALQAHPRVDVSDIIIRPTGQNR